MVKKILVLSKDKMMRDLLFLQLRNDYRIVVSDSIDNIGMKQVIELERPDLVILDIMEPQLEGLARALIIRREISEVPVLILSIYQTDEVIIIAGINLNAESVLTKPYNKATLKARIEQALEPVRE